MENLFERGEWTPGLHCDPLRKILIALQDRFESLDGLWRMTPELLECAAEKDDNADLFGWENCQHAMWLSGNIPSIPNIYVERRSIKGMGTDDLIDEQRFLFVCPDDTADTQRLCLQAWYNDGNCCTWHLSGEGIAPVEVQP